MKTDNLAALLLFNQLRSEVKAFASQASGAPPPPSEESDQVSSDQEVHRCLSSTLKRHLQQLRSADRPAPSSSSCLQMINNVVASPTDVTTSGLQDDTKAVNDTPMLESDAAVEPAKVTDAIPVTSQGPPTDEPLSNKPRYT